MTSKEKKAEYQRNYYQKHKTELNDRRRELYVDHKEVIQERNTNWRLNNPEKYKASMHKTYMDLRVKVVAELGGKCVRCGFNDIRALAIDHVNGGGRKHRESFNGNYYRYYKFILDNVNSGEYQILCANCNAIKNYETT